MSRRLMIALTNARPGREAELQQWYRERHVRDLVAVPGIVSARLFDVSMMKAPGGLGFQNLAVYEIEAGNAQDVLDECNRRMGTPRMPMSSALDSDGTLALLATLRDDEAA